MTEKDVVQFLNDLVVNLAEQAEEYIKSEEYKNIEKRQEELYDISPRRRTEEQNQELEKISQYFDDLEQTIAKKVVSSLSVDDIESVFSYITTSFIVKNSIDFSRENGLTTMVNAMLDKMIDQNADFASRLLENNEFMEALYTNNDTLIMQNIFEHVSDENLILDCVTKESNNLRNVPYDLEKNELRPTNVIENMIPIVMTSMASKEFKIRLLQDENILQYLSGYYIEKAVLNIKELTSQDRLALVQAPQIAKRLSQYNCTNITNGCLKTLEEYQQALSSGGVKADTLLQNNHLPLEDLKTLLFTDELYKEINEFSLEKIITSSDLTFEERKELLLDSRIMTKLSSINITSIFASKVFSEEERDILFKDSRIATKIYNPATFDNNLSTIVESEVLSPEEKLKILTDDRMIEGLSSFNIEKLLADSEVSTEMATEILFNKQLFYKLINEYYPEYNPTGYNKGPFKYDKYEYVKKLYEKNPNIAKTLCFRLLNDNILDLGFDLIERISKYYTLGSSIASLYTGLGEPVYFENILKSVSKTANANLINIESLIPTIINMSTDTSNYSDNPKERRQLSKIRYNGKVDIPNLTTEDWKTLSYIGFRDYSPYYNNIKMTLWGVMKEDIDISLNILPDVLKNEDLQNYEQKRQELCNRYFQEAINANDLTAAKNAYFNKYFSINIEEAKAIVKMYAGSIEKLSQKTEYNQQTSYILEIMNTLNIKKLNQIQQFYQQPNIEPISFDDILYMDQSIRQIFSKEMSDCVYKTSDKIADENGNLIENKPHMMSFTIEEDGKISTKQVPVYEPGFDFKMLIHSTAAYGEMELINNNYFDSWNKSLRTSNHGICCSLIANNNLGMADVKDVLLGFDSWDKQAISQSSPYDLCTYNDNFNLQEGRFMRFFTPQDIIDNTRHTHNEQTLERLELRSEKRTKKCTNIQPSYVIIYSDMEDNIKQKAIKCSEEMNIPIVYLDKEKIVNHEKDKIDLTTQACKNTSDYDEKFTMLERIIVSHENNRSGLRMTNPEWLEKYFPTSKIDQLIKETISTMQNDYLITDDIATYYESSMKLIDILDKEQEKFNIAQDATSRTNEIDLPIEEYKKSIMQLIDNSLSHSNTEKLETIIENINCQETDTNTDQIILSSINDKFISKLQGLGELYPKEEKNHNTGHVERVMLLSQIIGKSIFEKENGQSAQENIDLLVQCAKYHDCGRSNDATDVGHSKRSVEKMQQLLQQEGYSDNEIHIMQAAVEYHEYEDEESTFNRICKKYDIPEKEIEKTRQIANCLKDADALDRVRFHDEMATLKKDKLRTEVAKGLISTATDLIEYYQSYDKTEFSKKCQELQAARKISNSIVNETTK